MRQILPKTSSFDFLRQVVIRGADHPHINLLVLLPADGTETPILQQLQKFRLREILFQRFRRGKGCHARPPRRVPVWY